ncbi:MAG: serine/threonine-protein kinase [Chloroflexota bacterium]
MPFPSSMFAQSGRFTDIRLIGQGAAGQVYYARDNLGREVAVKEALPNDISFQSMRAKFEKESQLQAALQHPNIVLVYHLEEDPETSELYLICEYANGGSLADHLQQQGTLTEQEALHIAMDITTALGELQRHKIVHRDVKPSNILLYKDDDGRITTAKLSDFGIAQDQKMRRTTILPGTMHPGTPMYMAPEQSNVMTILDTRADIFALGTTLWEGLTNEDYKPLVVQQDVLDIREYNPLVSRGTATVLSKMVEHEAPQRYQTAHDLHSDLRLVQRGKTLELLAAKSDRQYDEPTGYTDQRNNYAPIVLLLASVGMMLVSYLFVIPGQEPAAPQAGPAPVEEAVAEAIPEEQPAAEAVAVEIPLPRARISLQSDESGPTGVSGLRHRGEEYLALTNGSRVLFSEMQSLEVIEVRENEQLVVEIVLHDGEIIDGVTRHTDDTLLEGDTEYGSFELELGQIRRIDFEE